MILSEVDFVRGGFCPPGDFVRGGFCPGGFCPGGFCPGGFSLRGFCPDPIFNYYDLALYYAQFPFKIEYDFLLLLILIFYFKVKFVMLKEFHSLLSA